jgi:Tfp pilus assembly pilus retraction ATPase PilT
MDVEEMVALSVKHNVSDLHLCSDGLRAGADVEKLNRTVSAA